MAELMEKIAGRVGLELPKDGLLVDKLRALARELGVPESEL